MKPRLPSLLKITTGDVARALNKIGWPVDDEHINTAVESGALRSRRVPNPKRGGWNWIDPDSLRDWLALPDWDLSEDDMRTVYRELGLDARQMKFWTKSGETEKRGNPGALQ